MTVRTRHIGPPSESSSDRLKRVTTVITMDPFVRRASRQCPLLKLETLKVRRRNDAGAKGRMVSTKRSVALIRSIYRRVPPSRLE